MRYIKFNLSDKTPVKFKIKTCIPTGIYIQWKYIGKINFPKIIDINIPKIFIYNAINIMEQISNDELIKLYRDLIEKDHKRLLNRKRII